MTKALITGATGFIGGRLAEMLCERETSVVALVRTWSQAARLSRLSVEMLAGDVLDLASVREAAKGCEVIYHCAVDWRGDGRANRRSSQVGTRNVLQAARDAGVQRVVFLSSVSVFGRRLRSGPMTEADPTPYTDDDYGNGKIDAEKAALSAYSDHGLPVTILRPTIVYGPFSRSWTGSTVAMIREGRMVLVNGGTGICNALYVDNLVDAMLLSARHPKAVGEIFQISDAQPVSWKEFVEGHARALGDGYLPLAEMSVAEIEAARAEALRLPRSSLKQAMAVMRDPKTRNAIREIPIVARFERAGRWTFRTLMPAPVQLKLRELARGMMSGSAEGNGDGSPTARPLMTRSLVFTHSAQTVFSVEKAHRVLGYEPRINFADGMARTAAWIEWARL